MRLGKHQQQIIQAMRDGAELYQEGRGFWSLYREPGRGRRVPHESCMGLYTRRVIDEVEAEEHPLYTGGIRRRYVLVDQPGGEH